MTTPPHLRVFAKVAHPALLGPPSLPVAAVVRFYLRSPCMKGRLPIDPYSGRHVGAPPAASSPLRSTTVVRTFQFGELSTFLEIDKARAAVSGMLSLLPLDLAAESFQAWAGFISSVLGVAASRSRRRKLGGVLGIVRIDCFEAEAGAEVPTTSREASNWDGIPGGVLQPAEASARCSCGEEGGGAFEDCSCPICWEGCGQAAGSTRMPCGHGFHRACIARWLRCRHTCPVCRFQIL